MIHYSKYRTVSLEKAFDLTHGYGWHCQICDNPSFKIGYGFSKNKFTAYRLAIKDIQDQ